MSIVAFVSYPSAHQQRRGRHGGSKVNSYRFALEYRFGGHCEVWDGHGGLVLYLQAHLCASEMARMVQMRGGHLSSPWAYHLYPFEC